MPVERRKAIFAAVAVAILVAVGVAGFLYLSETPTTPATTNPCFGPGAATEVVAPGWVASFHAGCPALGGNITGGSETMHLVGHDGMLFAAVGYWEDTQDIYYGGNNSSQGWAQILRLDGPNDQWAVDLTMTGVVRPDSLISATFTTNATGAPLAHPVNLLLAAGCKGSSVYVYTRNDTTGQWVTHDAVAFPAGTACDARAMAVYQDPMTGVDRVFVSDDGQGVFSGVYDPSVPGDILWNTTSESGAISVRPLAIIEANGNLFFSSGALIYERINGPSPSWTVVVNETALPGGTEVDPADGGIRGLTAISDPNGTGQSMLFLWVPDNASSIGQVIRLDPNGSGGYTSTIEVTLSSLAGKYLNTTAHFVLGAYNNFLPVTDPATGGVDYIVGMQVGIGGGPGLPTMFGHNGSGGIYQGGLYGIRDPNGTWRIGEVNGRFPAGNSPLESIRTYALSPFASDDGNGIYFGGYDADEHLCFDTAWVFGTTLTNALGEDGSA
jgi:poly(A) polymerase